MISGTELSGFSGERLRSVQTDGLYGGGGVITGTELRFEQTDGAGVRTEAWLDGGGGGGHNELSWTDRTLRFLSLARLVS